MVCVRVVCDTLKKPVSVQNVPMCTFKNVPRENRHHAHMCFNMCARCRHVLNVHTGDVLDGTHGEGGREGGCRRQPRVYHL